jgi:hypothetical protein
VIKTTGELIATPSLIRRPCTSGIHSAINSKIRAGNVGRLLTGNERDDRSDLVNIPIAVSRNGISAPTL